MKASNFNYMSSFLQDEIAFTNANIPFTYFENNLDSNFNRFIYISNMHLIRITSMFIFLLLFNHNFGMNK